MMARLIWKSQIQSLVRHSEWVKGHRHRSSKANWVEIDGVKLLEDHVHRLMVKKATPNWLPFLPGSSFWVPPPPSPFLHKFSIPSHPFFLQDDESGIAIATPQATEVTVQLKVMTPTENLLLSEDDEG